MKNYILKNIRTNPTECKSDSEAKKGELATNAHCSLTGRRLRLIVHGMYQVLTFHQRKAYNTNPAPGALSCMERS